MTIMRLEPSDKIKQINSTTNAPKCLFFTFSFVNVVAGFVPLTFFIKR